MRCADRAAHRRAGCRGGRAPGSSPSAHGRGRIAFEGLSFGYAPPQWVFAGFTLAIEAGETVALVGHTGAGKSTLGRLLARFYEYQGGRLLIDGRDIRTLDLRQYRRHVAMVPQVPFLVARTVADNIRYARPSATDADVRAAAYAIAGGEWLETLPRGLETAVGERGLEPSTGQRQLVALARAVLQDPSIIILDEATASVDPLTEAQIQEGLDSLLRGRTAIVIAHRLSAVRHADRIVALWQGRIVEEGSHAALLRRGGYYAHLYNTYFRHQAADYQPGAGFVPLRTHVLPPDADSALLAGEGKRDTSTNADGDRG